MEDTKEIEKFIKTYPLPSIFHWYTVADRTVFPIHGASGGLCASFGACLIEKEPQGIWDLGRFTDKVTEACGGRWIFVEFPIHESPEMAKNRVLHAISILAAAGTMKEAVNA